MNNIFSKEVFRKFPPAALYGTDNFCGTQEIYAGHIKESCFPSAKRMIE